MRMSGAVALTTVGLILGGCQTLTEELPSQSTPSGVGIPAPPPVIVIPVPIPSPEAPGGAPVQPPVSPPTGGDPGGQIPSNTNPVAKVGAKVYFVECDGVMVPDSEFTTQVQVGCRIHFDCTPKDAQNNPTQAQSPPVWNYSPGSLLDFGNINDFTPVAWANAPGNVTVYVVIDGVTSNSLNINLYN